MNVEKAIHSKIVFDSKGHNYQNIVPESSQPNRLLVKSIMKGAPMKRQSKKDTDAILHSYEEKFGPFQKSNCIIEKR